jgi:hypothetical protein
MTAPYRWTGTIRKDGDGISAVLVDNFGFTITLTGQRSTAGYAVVGINGHVPEAFLVPWLDDAVDGDRVG